MASNDVRGTKTQQNLKDALLTVALAAQRYAYFGKQAEVAGKPDAAGLFHDSARKEASTADELLSFFKSAGDPATGLPFGNTEKNLKSAISSELNEAEAMYAQMAQQARADGLSDIADCFDNLVKQSKTQAGRFQRALENLDF